MDVFRKLLLIRSCCPDRTLAQVPNLAIFTCATFFSQARKYIYSSLGADFLENAVLDIEHLLEESDNKVRVFLRERLNMEIFNGICHEGGEGVDA